MRWPAQRCRESAAESSAATQALMTRSPEELAQPWGKLMCLGLGLLFMGKQLATEATLEV